MKTVDARNLACPEPVIRTKKALDESNETEFTVLLNSPESYENVTKLAKSQGCAIKSEQKGKEYTLTLTRTSKPATTAPMPVTTCATCGTVPAATGGVWMVTSDELGGGDAELGKKLMVAILNTISQTDERPMKMMFLNRGVFLMAEGSPVLESLQKLENAGVEIVACQTCLKFYELTEKLKVGSPTNMLETANSLLTSEKIVRL
jgi:selenium metabolism protein YedF